MGNQLSTWMTENNNKQKNREPMAEMGYLKSQGSGRIEEIVDGPRTCSR